MLEALKFWMVVLEHKLSKISDLLQTSSKFGAVSDFFLCQYYFKGIFRKK